MTSLNDHGIIDSSTSSLSARPLPLRVRAKSGEAAHSHMLRLAARNGFKSYATFASLLGVDRWGRGLAASAEVVAAKAGVDPKALLEATPVVMNRHVMHHGHRLNVNHMVRRQRRICGACFASDLQEGGATEPAFLRSWWDLDFLSVCPEHRICLRNDCPSCGRALDADRTDLVHCRCGASLAEDFRAELPESAILGDLYLLGRMDIVKPRAIDLLDNVSLQEALKALTLVGRTAIYGGGAVQSRRRLPSEERASIMTAGLRALSDVPGSFLALLDGVVPPNLSSKAGGAEAYGRLLYEWLNKSPLAASLGLTSIMLDHLSGCTTRRSHRTATGPVPRNIESWRRRSSELTPEETVRFTKSVQGAEGAELPRRLTQAAAWKFGQAIGEILGTKEAARYLQASTATFEGLVEGGAVSAAWSVSGSGRARFYRSDLDELCSLMSSGATVLSGSTAGLVSLTDVGRVRAVRTSDAVRAVLSGDLIVRAMLPGARGFRRFLVSKDDLAQLDTREVPSQMLTTKALAEALEINAVAAAALHKGGFISGQKHGHLRVTPVQEIEAFGTIYASSVMLARTHAWVGVPKNVVKLMRTEGCTDILGLRAGTRIYPKTHALKILRREAGRLSKSLSTSGHSPQRKLR